jgi:hypothetical protein
MRLPDIPQTWIILSLLIALVIMRYFGIDSWTTASLGILVGYLTGKDAQNRKK